LFVGNHRWVTPRLKSSGRGAADLERWSVKY
jgi:hypothetical protein